MFPRLIVAKVFDRTPPHCERAVWELPGQNSDSHRIPAKPMRIGSALPREGRAFAASLDGLFRFGTAFAETKKTADTECRVLRT